MRILKILNGNNYGGVFTSELQFISYWKEQGITVDGIIIGKGVAGEKYEKLVHHYYSLPDFPVNESSTSMITYLRNMIARFRYGKQVFRMIQSGEYDAIIYRNAVFEHVAYLVGKKTGAKIFWHMPQSMRSFAERLYYQISLRVLGIFPVGNSRYTMETLGKQVIGYVYPGFDPNRVAGSTTDQTLRSDLGIPESAIVFGIAARIKENKAQHLVIDAVNLLLDMGEDIYLIVAGGPLDTEYALRCKRLATRHPGRIHFTGHIENIVNFYNTIQYYVNSRIDAEPFGISIAESLGSGVPVIAFDSGGPREMIEHGVNGWLIEKSTVDSYKLAMSEAVSRYKDYEKISLAAKQSIGQFQASLNANVFLSLIEMRRE